ncbi:MAG TPA: sigma-70 family RNA polymerase sigma factor [Jatrophihabitantaceae bacterium]|nr:sigma-70 family RNA polymerase sigma factor [Jatrophihabitantaceae bacterium]
MPPTEPAEPSSRPSERFDRVYEANLAPILGYAARRCDDPSDAADVAADVFLVAWRRLDAMPEGEERLWLFGIARRVLANHRRGRIRRHRLADRLREQLAVDPPVVDAAADPSPLLAAMRQLSDGDRELLQLAAWDGLSPSEIAALERIPASTVRSRLLRARARLRDVLDESDIAAVQRNVRAGHVSGVTPSTDSTTWSEPS